MSITDVTTWADGFGVWHAAVTESGNTIGDSDAAEAAALAAIRSELSDREGPNFAPGVVGVRLGHRDSRDGNLTSYFIETNAHEQEATT